MTVAACLIVKNEGAVIARCLHSLRGLVQAVVIVDTGSTDDTMDVIRGLDYPIPIHLHQRPWQDFAHNRTELLRLAAPTADYLLLLDADQTVAGHFPELTADAYNLRLRTEVLDWRKPLLIRSALPWRYEGVTHEYLVCEQAVPTVPLDSVVITEHQDGGGRPAGTQPRWEWDAAVLEKELARDPSNARYVFYLARTYEDLATTRPDDPQAGDWRRKAAERYRQRSQMGGYADEAFYSLYRLGVLRLAEGDGLTLLLEAWQRCPHRWEPVHEAVRWLNQRGFYQASYALSKRALASPPAPSGLFVHYPAFDHLLLFEHSISAYWVGYSQECWDACQTLLGRRLPQYLEEAVRRNMAFAQQRLDEQARVASAARQDSSVSPTPAVRQALAKQGDAVAKVSVITPTCQREKYLCGLYALFQGQTYPHLELLIHDDSPQPSAFFGALKDERVKYFHSPQRLAIGEKLNFLVEKAAGSIIVQFDDGDYYAPHYVQTMVENLGEADLVSLGGWYTWSVGAGAFCYWDTSCKHYFHYHLSQGRLKLVSTERFMPDFIERNLDGYGFSHVYRKAVFEVVTCTKKTNQVADYNFVSGLRAAGKTIKHIQDEAALAVHIIHQGNTSSCYPQYLLPAFMADRLFPGLRAYLDTISADRETEADPQSQPLDASGQQLVSFASPHSLHPLVGREGSSDSFSFHQIFSEREYSCLDDLTDPQLILDCGANAGYSAAYFLSRFPRCRVIAVEPDPGNFAILQRNLSPFGERAQTIQAAVWSHPTTLKLSEVPYRDGREWARQVRECRQGEAADLSATDIGTLLRESGYSSISVLKVDIEAAEKVVFGSNYESWIGSVENIVIELHDEECAQTFHRAITGQPFQIGRSGELTVCKRLCETRG